MKLKKEEIILVVVLLIYAATDAWRDAWIQQDWWSRHIIKWISFYTLPIYILLAGGYLKKENWRMLAWIAAGGLFFWELFYWLFS